MSRIRRWAASPEKRGKGLTEPGPLASLRPLRLPDMTGERIAEWMKEEGRNRPTMAALSYRQLRAFIRWASEYKNYSGLIPSDAYKARDVKDAVPRVKAKEGDVLQREQLAAWFAAVRKIPNRVQSVYLQSLLLTGARREEMAAVRWEDVDLRWRSLTLDDKVEGTGGRVIPLTPYLASLFEELKRLNETPPSDRRLATLAARGKAWEPSPWVFASPTAEDGKIAEPRAAHVKALQQAGLPHVSIHGLRRSFGTLSEWVEAPVGVVAQIQGHKPSAVAESTTAAVRWICYASGMTRSRRRCWSRRESRLKNLAPSAMFGNPDGRCNAQETASFFQDQGICQAGCQGTDSR